MASAAQGGASILQEVFVGADLEAVLLCLHLMMLRYVFSSGLLGRSMGCAPSSVLVVQVKECET